MALTDSQLKSVEQQVRNKFGSGAGTTCLLMLLVSLNDLLKASQAPEPDMSVLFDEPTPTPPQAFTPLTPPAVPAPPTPPEPQPMPTTAPLTEAERAAANAEVNAAFPTMADVSAPPEPTPAPETGPPA